MLDWTLNEDGTCTLLDDCCEIGSVNDERYAMAIVHAVNEEIQKHRIGVDLSLHACELNRLHDGSCSVCGEKA